MSTTLAIVINGWRQSPRPAPAGEPSNSTSNWTCCSTCGNKRGANLLGESRKHTITAKLRQIPSLGPIRSALAVALIQTPYRFRSKRQLWTYSGLRLETRDSGEYHFVKGQVRRRKKQVRIRGLNKDYNHDLKGLFKAAAIRASVLPGPFQDFYQRSLAKGIKPTMVRLTLARKIAAVSRQITGFSAAFEAACLFRSWTSFTNFH